MSARTIRFLAVAVVVLFAAVWLLNRERTGDTTTDALLFPDLKERLDEVTAVRISDTDSELRVVREGDRWVVPGKDGYPADTAVLRDLLLGIAEARKIEQKTSDSELYDRLGVQDPEEEGASGVLVQSEGLDDADFALVLGDPVQRDYRYVRVPDESTSWLIDRNPDVPDEAAGWLYSEVADIASSRVQSVTILHGEGQTDGQTIGIHKESEDDTNFTVEDIPEGRELSYPSVANSVAAALDNLTLEDVRRAGDEAAEGETATEDDNGVTTATTVFTTFDGLEVTVDSTTEDEATWITLSAAALPLDSEDAAEGGDTGQTQGPAPDEAESSPEEPAEATGASGEEAAGAAEGEASRSDAEGGHAADGGDAAEAGNGATAEDAEEAPDPATEAAEINARVAGWEYRIPQYKASQLTRHWEDLLSNPETETDEE